MSSDRAPGIFYERESTATQDHLRVLRLSRDLRARFAALGLHGAYALFTSKPFKGWAHPGFTQPDSTGHVHNRKMVRPPEYPTRRPDEDPRHYRLRVEKFHLDNAAYKQFAADYVADGIERLVEKIEALTSEGEFWAPPHTKRSTLLIAEKDWQPCELPVYAAKLAARDYKQFYPPVPAVPPGTQFSLF